jgi:hypothetical protein
VLSRERTKKRSYKKERFFILGALSFSRSEERIMASFLAECAD